MSTYTDRRETEDEPDPHDDPEAFIRQQFDGLRDEVEALAELDLEPLSEDARCILKILDQEDSS